MFGLSNFIITEFLLIFYLLVTNVLYSYISNSDTSIGGIDNQYLNSNTQLGEFLEGFFASNENIRVSIYNMDERYF